jgi:membrane protease YdiL (CAAX protease family)
MRCVQRRSWIVQSATARTEGDRVSDEPTTMTGPVQRAPQRGPFRPGLELLLVLGASLGASAVYSVLSFLDDLTRGPLAGQTTTLNPRQNDRAIFDLVYQVLGNLFPLVPVLLALYLLATPAASGACRIGLDLRRPRFDVGVGVLLLAAIGVPGIGLYFAARGLGLNLAVQTSGIGAEWYAIPVLVLSAARAALQEEVIVVGFLFERLRDLRRRPWLILTASALLRGSYHLYQGVGGFVGNAIMGFVFGLLYRRFGRVGPLVVAHFLLDLFSFVGVAVLELVAPGLLPR